MTYLEFLKTKELKTIAAGFDYPRERVNENAFEYQKDIILWAIKKGKAAILTGCGTGKTFMQAEYARIVTEETGGKALILAPLSVVEQTVRDARKFGIAEITPCRSQEDVRPGINITNYEMIDHFDPGTFNCVVLDESSILKSYTSKTQEELTEKFAETPYKLLCTATIAPNDYTEIGTSSEFLGIMSRAEMLATYFIHDGGDTSKWRLKKSGAKKFWEWFATWAMYFNSPEDLGYHVDGFDLPDLIICQMVLKSEASDYELFVIPAETLEERRMARKESLKARAERAAALVNGSKEPWLIWCDYNEESAELKRVINQSVEIRGADSPETKAKASIDFADNKIHALISKPSIFGFGSNFQNCHNMIFCGLSDSYERFYQAVRRCWRFGQTKQTNVYVILSEKEINMLLNIERKEKLMEEMQKEMTSLMRDVTLSEIRHTTRITTEYNPRERMIAPPWLKS